MNKPDPLTLWQGDSHNTLITLCQRCGKSILYWPFDWATNETFTKIGSTNSGQCDECGRNFI